MRIENEMRKDDLNGFRLLAYLISRMSVDTDGNGKSTFETQRIGDDLSITEDYIERHSARKSGQGTIYDWLIVYQKGDGKGSTAYQIVTDAKLDDGVLRICFNHHLMDDLVRYRAFYAAYLADILMCTGSYERFLSIT